MDENTTPPDEGAAATSTPLTEVKSVTVDQSAADPAKYPTQLSNQARLEFGAALNQYKDEVVRPALGTLVKQMGGIAEREKVPRDVFHAALVYGFAEAIAAQALIAGGVTHWRRLAKSVLNEAMDQAYAIEVQERQAAKRGPQEQGAKLEAVPDAAPTTPPPAEPEGGAA